MHTPDNILEGFFGKNGEKAHTLDQTQAWAEQQGNEALIDRLADIRAERPGCRFVIENTKSNALAYVVPDEGNVIHLSFGLLSKDKKLIDHVIRHEGNHLRHEKNTGDMGHVPGFSQVAPAAQKVFFDQAGVTMLKNIEVVEGIVEHVTNEETEHKPSIVAYNAPGAEVSAFQRIQDKVLADTGISLTWCFMRGDFKLMERAFAWSVNTSLLADAAMQLVGPLGTTQKSTIREAAGNTAFEGNIIDFSKAKEAVKHLDPKTGEIPSQYSEPIPQAA